MKDIKTEYVQTFRDLLQTPSYIYFMNEVYDRLESLKGAFRYKLDISYSIKANPNRSVVRFLGEYIQYYDVSSLGEFNVAMDAGIEPERITFVGPGKTNADLKAALLRGCGYIVAEDEEEIGIINKIGQENKIVQKTLIRVNPLKYVKGFGIYMSSGTAQFGIPEECLEDVIKMAGKMPWIKLSGFHVFTGTQCLSEESLVNNMKNILNIFTEFSGFMDQPSELNIIGAGFGVPYFDRDEKINLKYVGVNIEPYLEDYLNVENFKKAKIALESGRYIIGEAGIYISKVIKVKQARKCTVAILEGGMNHNMAATGNLGTLIKRNYKITTTSNDEKLEDYYIYGPLCTNIDIVAREIKLPTLDAGDIIIIKNSGAYGFSASPLGFITHRIPREYMVLDYNEPPIDITSENNLAYIGH